MAYSRRHVADMFPHSRGENAKRVALRFVDTFALHQRGSVGRANVEGAIAASNAVSASGQEWLFVAGSAIVHAELQRRRAAVQHKNQIVLVG